MEDEEARKETMATSLESSGKITCFVVASCVMAAMGGVIFGYDIGVSGGVMSMSPFLERFFPRVYNLEEEDQRKRNNNNNNHYCLFNSQLLTSFTSSLYVSGFVATLLASYVTRSWGRKPSIFIGGVAFLVGSALGGAAQNVAMLIIARLLLGVGVGFANQSVPLYLSEMSPAKHRGAISNGFQLCIGIGFLMANLINYETQKIEDGYGWRISLATAAIPALILTLGSLFLPETPNSIVQTTGDVRRAEIILRRIRGRDDVGDELADLVEACSNANANAKTNANSIGSKNANAIGNINTNTIGSTNATGKTHANANEIGRTNNIAIGSTNANTFENAKAFENANANAIGGTDINANAIGSTNANAIRSTDTNAFEGKNANANAIGGIEANAIAIGGTYANANTIGGRDANADKNTNAIVSRNANAHQAFVELLERRYRPELVMALAIPFFQQVTGINVVAFYAPVLFRTVGFGESGSLMSTLVTGIIGTASTFLSMLVVDKIGRKTLFLIGGIQMLASQVTIGAIIMTTEGTGGVVGERHGYAVVVLVCVYVAGFGWSWGPLGWLVPSEIFPLEIRSAAQSLTVAVSFFFTFAVAQSVPPMLCKFRAGIFFFYGGWVVVMTVAAQMFLPETKNVPIEKVGELWEKHWFWRRITRKRDTQETTIIGFS